MFVSVGCYILRRDGGYRFTPIAPGLFNWSVASRDAAKGQKRTIERIQKECPKLPFPLFARLALPPGRALERVHLELKVSDGGDSRQIAGLFPVIVEPRPAGGDRTLRIGYHPLRPADWFEVDPGAPLAEQVRSAYSRIFEPDDDFAELKIQEGDRLQTLRLDVEPPSLLKLLEKDDPKQALGLGQMAELEALLRITVNQTARAALGKLAPGLSREPYRTRLQHLLTGPKKSSVLIVGPAGSGKSTLIARAVHDLLEADGYLVHRNLDRTHTVLSIQGRHVIAGMSRVGQWEARAVELLHRARKRGWIFWSDDVHAWASLGRTTVSDRALADFFRGPIARGDLIVIGECTPEQLSLLEHDAPALAACFTKLHVEPAGAEETLAMLLHASRRIEAELPSFFHPSCFGAILEYSASLYPNTAFPGKALRVLGPLAAKPVHAETRDERGLITPEHVLQHFCKRTGLPEALLSADAPLDRAQLGRELGQQVLGQDAGLEAALDLVLAIRARVSAPGRPYGVFLFTGPTGTGKTELAKCLAEYLYGDARRLVRFDMAEFSGADAASRLIGDRQSPEGLLTSALAAQPFSLLLLDEIEKAHPLVLNLLLQVFDDGRLANARGNVADFTRAVIVMTSNLGGERAAIRGFVEDPASLSSEIARAVSDFFPAELFNRIDRVVPFEPLGRPIARAIAKKELARLAARPGLAHRNVFLHVTAAVVDHTLEHGYDAKYGARAVKRFIDRAVGDVLSRAVASERSAEMRVLWLHASAAGLEVHSEALREAELLPEASPIEALLSAAPATLPTRIPQALATLEQLERDGRLEELGERLEQEIARFRADDGAAGGADRVHHLDAVRQRFTELKERFETLLASDPELLRATDRDLAREHDEALESTRFLPRRQARARPPLSPHLAADKRLLADLAEVSFFESLLDAAPESAEHGAVIDVLRLAAHHERRRFSSGSPGLLEWLSDAYASARGRFEAGAVALEDGKILQASRLEDFRTLLEHRPRQATVRIAGVGVRSFLWAETGCHVRRAVGSGPEIARVLLLPDRLDPAEYLREHATRRAGFEASLEGRGTLAENPESLLPVVRRITFDPSGGGAATATIEDYRFAHIATREVRKLGALLEDFWLLAAGTRPSGGTP